MLVELEKFVSAFGALAPDTSVCIFASAQKSVFSAGGDLRELYATAAALPEKDRPAGIRAFLERIPAVLTVNDAAPFFTIPPLHPPCPCLPLELAPPSLMTVAP